MAKQKTKEQITDGVVATREINGKQEERKFTVEAWQLIGSNPEHNGGWFVPEAETPAEAEDLDPQL
jgi:hypothetical protein